jgi:hypothetical protein
MRRFHQQFRSLMLLLIAGLSLPLWGTAAAAVPPQVVRRGFPNVLELGPSDRATMQAAVDTQLDRSLGGTQISQYEISWKSGSVVMALPAPGASFAPPGSTAALRSDATAINMPASASLAEKEAALRPARPSPMITFGSSSSCPYGINVKWYCWYTDSNFNGARFQFMDYYCYNNPVSDHKWINFGDYARDNEATSWVNNTSRTIRVYDGRNASSVLLWSEGHVSNSPNVGASSNDRASSAMTC